MELRPYQLQSGIYKMHWGEKCPYFYYGQTTNFKNRQINHFNKLRYKGHWNRILQNVFNKYGLPIFEIIETCDVKELDNREQYYLTLYFNHPHNCNLAPFVRSSRGVVCSDETRQKLRLQNLGSKKSEETRRKISERKKMLTQEQRINISNGQKGKMSTDEANEKRRQYMLNVDNDYRERMRMIKLGTYTGALNHSSKIVLDLNTGIFYDSLKEVAIYSPFKYGNLKMMLSGRSKNKTSLVYA
jgi:group I intron endonuclease